MAGGATTDTFTVSGVSYSGTTLTMTITNTTYGMKNPDFTIGSDSGDVTTTRSGYLSNPYTLTVNNINLTAGNTYNLSINYMDYTDSGTAVTASGTFTVPGTPTLQKIVQLVDHNGNNLFPYSVTANANIKNIVVSSTDIGEGASLEDGTIYIVI